MMLTLFFQEAATFAISEALFSYDVWKDFILPIVIAFSAGYMVYWGFVKETKRDKEKELEAEKQLQKDKLYYFSNTVKTILAISRDQNAAILAFVERQFNDPSEVQDIVLFSSNQLRRVTADLKLESYMLAYVNCYASERKEAIKQFNNIVIRIDMLYESFKSVEQHHNMAQDIDRTYKTKFSNYQHIAYNLVATLSLSLRVSAPHLAMKIDRIATVFQSDMNENANAGFYYRNFFVPYNELAVKYVDSGLLEVPQIRELAILTRDGKSAYEQMIRENTRLAEEFKNLYDHLKNEIDLLKEYAKRLLEDFGD